jgi:signal transduction histidine kinase
MQFDPNAPTSTNLRLPKDPHRPRRFRSLRWRLLTPVAAVLLVVLMSGAYGLAYMLVGEDEGGGSQDDLIAGGHSVAENAVEVGRQQRTEVDRIAFTQGVKEAILVNDGAALQPIVEPLAALSGYDLVVIGDTNGNEVMGLQRVVLSGVVDYAVAEGTQLTGIAAVSSVLQGADSASVLVAVERRPMLVTAGPVLDNGAVVGVVLVGQDITRVLDDLRGGSVAEAELALFSGAGDFVASTRTGLNSISLESAVYTAALNNPQETQFERVEAGDTTYEAAYFPFIIGQTPLGVVALYHPPGSLGGGFTREWVSLFAALVVAVVGITFYSALRRPLRRLDSVRATVDQLAGGQEVRTGMKPHDEIGELAVAVDRYSAAVGAQVRQQRRELAHMNAILESLPDGIVVQDMEGRVMTMNAAARSLLGAYGDTPGAIDLRKWSARVQERVGTALAPGLYMLGDSTQIQVENRVLQVEAAAVQSVADKRIGTVITLRDISDVMRQEAKRDALVDALANDVHVSLSARAQAAALEAGTRPNAAFGETLANFAREIAQDARAMQRMIADYRELALLQPDELRQNAHPVDVVDLLMTLAEEWSPTAIAAGVSLDVGLPEYESVHILGDEKRLLWAFGNFVENAIKYSGGAGSVRVTVQPQIEKSRLKLAVEDQGVGISADDLPHVFTRFYRGKPATASGETLNVPGTGQGLYFAHKIIEAHGGSTGLTSAPGQGTQVSAWLPMTANVMLELPSVASQASIWDMPTRTDVKLR